MHRLWIFNHYATTPLTGPLLRHYYFAEYLKERNIETTVFAANELHQTGGCVDTHGKPYLRTEEEGVPFVFVKTSKYEGNGISRVKNMVSFFLGLLKISKGYAKQYGKPDVIMGSSAHPLTSIAGILIARRFHVPAIVEVRDLWPEAIFSFGKVKMNSLVGRLLSAGEKWMYVHADAIVFTKEGDVDHIKEMGWDKDHGGKIDLAKCHYINNGVNLKDYYASIEKDILKDPDLEDDSFKVVYTGTVRPVNNVGNLLDTAKLLKDKSYDFFYLKDELYEIGIIEMKTPYGNKIKVYDLERTICDIIRNKKRIEIALFTDAMKRYVERKDRNSIRLHKYAKLFNIEDEIRKYLEVLL